MAIGFSPQHIQDLSLKERSPEQFLSLAFQAAVELGWSVKYLSAHGLIAYSKGWGEEITVKLQDGTAIVKSQSSGSWIDWGKNKKNTDRLITQIETLETTLSHEQLADVWEKLKPSLVPPEQDLLLLPPPTFKENLMGFFSFFIPREGYFITPILVNLNLLIYILMVASGVDFMEPATESLLQWGANFKPATLSGEWWRLITCSFLHIGLFHLLMNMYALVYIGLLLEPYLGKVRFTTAYLLTALTSSMASLWWHDHVVSAGASGAIFGMYGVFLAMLTSNLIEKEERQALLGSIAIFVGYNLLNGLRDGIDNAGHIGGLAGGLVIGYAYLPVLRQKTSALSNYAIVAGLCLFLGMGSFYVFQALPNDTVQYEELLVRFSKNENEALKVFDLPEQTPQEALRTSVRKGIEDWKENIRLSQDMLALDLDEKIQERSRALKSYSEWRLKSYRLIDRSFEKNIPGYEDSLMLYNEEIKQVLERLNQQ